MHENQVEATADDVDDFGCSLRIISADEDIAHRAQDYGPRLPCRCGIEQWAQFETERASPEWVELDQHCLRCHAVERRQKRTAASVPPGIIDRPTVDIDNRAEAAIACARRRELDEVGSAEFEILDRLAPGDEG